MKKLFLSLLFLPLLASAGYTLSSDELEVKFNDVACTNRFILTLVKNTEYADLNWFTADVVWKGNELTACWADHGDRVLIVDEGGSAGMIKKERLTKD